MHIEQDIEEILELLKRKAGDLRTCYHLMLYEEHDTNDECVMRAWNVIISKYAKEIHNLLNKIKEKIQWTLLNDGKDVFREINSSCASLFAAYKLYLGKEYYKLFSDISSLLSEGENGFRQSMIEEGYHERLFQRHLDNYRLGNEERLTEIYIQDSRDNAIQYPDENQRKAIMLSERRTNLFKDKLGILFHDNRRSIKHFVAVIIDNNGKDYCEIDVLSFFDKYLAFLIADDYCNKKEEDNTFKNIIFKENVDVDKVIRKLNDFVDKRVISAKRHWYIAYRVFLKKEWLAKGNQTKFREQINSIFGDKLDCTENDFKAVDRYYKNNDYLDWSLEDNDAPQHCDDIKKIALALHNEFTDDKYAKPGKMINTRKIKKL